MIGTEDNVRKIKTIMEKLDHDTEGDDDIERERTIQKKLMKKIAWD